MLTIQTVGIVARQLAHHFNPIRRKFRSQTSDSMKRQRRERGRREEVREEKGRRKKIKVREKVEKMAKHCVFPVFCGFGRSKSRFPKATDAEPSGKMRNEKLHAVVARSKFRSQKAQNTSRPELFCLRCSKSAHRCGANHV